MEPTTSHPGLQELDALAGVWELQAMINGQEMGRARTEFTWMDGGAFLVQRSGVEELERATDTGWAESAPAWVSMIIGLDDSNQHYTALYADARGVFRVYQMTLNGREWRLWRDAPGFSQRFTGTFSDDRATIAGRWEASSDGVTWEYDFDLIYRKELERE